MGKVRGKKGGRRRAGETQEAGAGGQVKPRRRAEGGRRRAGETQEGGAQEGR